jgi:hypothetical protein
MGISQWMIKKGQATTYFKIGWVHKRKGAEKEAMQVDLGTETMEQLKDKSGIAGAMNRISEDLARQKRTRRRHWNMQKDHRI